MAALLIAYACSILRTTDDSAPFAVLAAVAGGVGLLSFACARRFNWSRVQRLGMAGLVLGLLIGPLVWAVETAVAPEVGSAARYPAAGPKDARDYPPTEGGDQPGPEQLSADPVLSFLVAHATDNGYLVLTERSLYGNAPRYILVANRPVLTLDSFSTEQSARSALEQLVAGDRLRYVELPPSGPWMDPSLSLGQWFLANCKDLSDQGLVPFGRAHLYDCKGNSESPG